MTVCCWHLRPAVCCVGCATDARIADPCTPPSMSLTETYSTLAFEDENNCY
jgi:hypothetical protein